MSRLLPIASGKGGVGKTIISANLGILLSQMGQKVIIVDLDLGGSNLHTVLGIKNDLKGLGHFINTKEQLLFQDIVHPTKYDNLFFVPGDALYIGTANLPFFKKKSIIKGLMALEAEWVILDLGAGTSSNILDFYLMSSSGIMVAIPEITSILNLYSFLKNAYYRYVIQHFKKKDIIREKLIEGATYRLEKDDFRFIEYVRLLKKDFPEKADEIEKALSNFYPKILFNISNNDKDINIGENLRNIISKNLGLDVEYLGVLPFDSNIEESVNDRIPIIEKFPESKWCNVLKNVSDRLVNYSRYPEFLYSDVDSIDVVLEDIAND